MNEPYRDKSNYESGKTVRCLGCGQTCHNTKWGKWCYKCNVERITRISKSFDSWDNGAD